MRTPLTLLLLSGALCGAAPAGASLITLPGSYTYTGGDGVGRFHSPNKGKDPGAPVAYVEYIGLTGQISERRATLHVEITRTSAERTSAPRSVPKPAYSMSR